ncbi:hypothetical protein NDU88_003969 [Pleurodeles waltl]|uniref:Uncharacterized protein n=1 Tax=Pleurodeles waltl TaxID=8319 RepID=A0AAV7SHM5_PLEWA|nr:hypothetical protein NDU88_003969 [Pleurodeles waltl]
MEHYRGRDLKASTMEKEKERKREADFSLRNRIDARETPGGRNVAGPKRHREKEQGSRESQRSSVRSRGSIFLSPRQRTLRSSPATFQKERGSTRYGFI